MENNSEILESEYKKERNVHRAVLEIIATLPLRQREAVMLRYSDGLEVPEVALAMKITQQNAATYLSLARKRIAVELDKRPVSRRDADLEPIPMGVIITKALRFGALEFLPTEAEWIQGALEQCHRYIFAKSSADAEAAPEVVATTIAAARAPFGAIVGALTTFLIAGALALGITLGGTPTPQQQTGPFQITSSSAENDLSAQGQEGAGEAEGLSAADSDAGVGGIVDMDAIGGAGGIGDAEETGDAGGIGDAEENPASASAPNWATGPSGGQQNLQEYDIVADDPPPLSHWDAASRDEDVPMIELGDKGVLLFSPTGTMSWALLNLILCVIGFLYALLSVERIVLKRRRERKAAKDYDVYGSMYDMDEFEKDSQTDWDFRPSWLVTSIAMAIVGGVLFLLTQDTRNPMVIVDWWTSIHAVIFAIQLTGLILITKDEKPSAAASAAAAAAKAER